jgi:hypothetical protein
MGCLKLLMTSNHLIFMTNNRIYAFVYGLFNDVAGTSHPIDYNDRIISELVGTDAEGGGCDLILDV